MDAKVTLRFNEDMMQKARRYADNKKLDVFTSPLCLGITLYFIEIEIIGSE